MLRTCWTAVRFVVDNYVVNCTSSYIQNRKRPCPSVCAAVSASINPLLSSDRLRCCDRYTRCQRSLAVKPLNSRLAMSGSPSHRQSVRRVSRYQFTHVWYRTAAAWHVQWQLANWCRWRRGANWLSETSLTATARGGGVGLWTLTPMCSITQAITLQLWLVNIISSIPSLSLNSLLGTLSFTLTLHIHDVMLECWYCPDPKPLIIIINMHIYYELSYVLYAQPDSGCGWPVTII